MRIHRYQKYSIELQPDAVLSQANPVSASYYPVLTARKNCRIIGIGVLITWAVTQPTPLELSVLVDGQQIVFSVANPVSATWYFANLIYPHIPNSGQVLSLTPEPPHDFLIEGREIEVDVRITWAVTQPTPLEVRVKYAKW